MSLERLTGFTPRSKVVGTDVGQALRVRCIRVERYHRDMLVERALNDSHNGIGVHGRECNTADAPRQQVSKDLDLFGFVGLRRSGIKNLGAKLFGLFLSAPFHVSKERVVNTFRHDREYLGLIRSMGTAKYCGDRRQASSD